MNKEKIKELLIKPDKAKALALAVAFVVTNPLMLSGCSEKYPYQEEEKDDQNNTQTATGGGGGYVIHSSTTFGKDSGTTWSKPSSSKSGYSSLRGGSSSS